MSEPADSLPPRIAKCLRAGVCVVLFWIGLLVFARAEILEGEPDAIVCSVRDPVGALPWAELVFYVSARTVEGSTLYKTLTSDPVVLLVSPAGVVSATNLADCDGRHVGALFEEGRAFVFAHAPPTRSGRPELP